MNKFKWIKSKEECGTVRRNKVWRMKDVGCCCRGFKASWLGTCDRGLKKCAVWQQIIAIDLTCSFFSFLTKCILIIQSSALEKGRRPPMTNNFLTQDIQKEKNPHFSYEMLLSFFCLEPILSHPLTRQGHLGGAGTGYLQGKWGRPRPFLSQTLQSLPAIKIWNNENVISCVMCYHVFKNYVIFSRDGCPKTAESILHPYTWRLVFLNLLVRAYDCTPKTHSSVKT